MIQTPAGGLHTQIPLPAEIFLEDGLKQAAAAVAALLADARTIDPRTDEYGHARSRAYSDAVALLKASAKVGHTIAELRGSKFEHNINVRREEAAPPQEASTPAPTGPGFGFQGRIRLTDGRVCMRAPNNRWRIIEDEDRPAETLKVIVPWPVDEDGFSKYQGCDFDPTVCFPDGKYFVRGMGYRHIPEDWDEEAWRRAQSAAGEGDTPTPISEGSNGNSATGGQSAGGGQEPDALRVKEGAPQIAPVPNTHPSAAGHPLCNFWRFEWELSAIWAGWAHRGRGLRRIRRGRAERDRCRAGSRCRRAGARRPALGTGSRPVKEVADPQASREGDPHPNFRRFEWELCGYR